MITFILGGIWHGAGWTFIFWGFLHGLALVIHRFWKSLGFALPKVLAWIVTFAFINFSWVFFRAVEWADAIKVLKGMLGVSGIVFPKEYEAHLHMLSSHHLGSFATVTEHIGGGNWPLLWIAVITIVILLFPNSNGFRDKKMNGWYMLIASIIFSFAVVKSLASSSEVFLYFNF